MAKQLNIPYVRIKEVRISEDVIDKIPAKFVFHYKLMPLKLENNVLTCAVTDPLNIQVIDDMKLLLGFEIKAVLASEKDILENINSYYGVGAETLEKMVSEKEEEIATSLNMGKTEDLEALTEDASVIKFVNQILLQAVQERATDIHIEPFQEEVKVRFRIDGILYPAPVPTTVKYFYSAVISRIKIMAQLNIAERRLPQDRKSVV